MCHSEWNPNTQSQKVSSPALHSHYVGTGTRPTPETRSPNITVQQHMAAFFQRNTIRCSNSPLENECFKSQMRLNVTAGPLCTLQRMSKRELRNEFHPISAVRVLCYSYVVDLTIEKCQQLSRRGSILRPLRARSAIGIQVRSKVDKVARQLSRTVDVKNIGPVDRTEYRQRLQAFAYCVEIDV